MKTKNYRKIYESYYGPIPKDNEGRTFEIHHIDGNRNNNSIENLKAVSIQEHYDIHYKNGDYGACVMIAKRLNLPKDYMSNIQKGKKRPGIGGVKKGTPSKFKGIKRGSLNISEEGLKRQSEARKRNNKITDEDAIKIRDYYAKKIKIDHFLFGKMRRNGKLFSYESVFCSHFSQIYNVSPQYIRRIITGKSKRVS